MVTIRLSQPTCQSRYDRVTHDKPRLLNVTLCREGLHIPHALRQRPVFPLTRVRSILNALKSLHCDGAMASYNKIVVCCNNFVFFFPRF